MTNIINLLHDYELACPILQEMIRRGLKEMNLSCAAVYDWSADSYMCDYADTEFLMKIPLVDDIIPNRYMVRHFLNGSYAPRYNDFLRWLVPLLSKQSSSFNIAMAEYIKLQQRQEWLH